MINDKIDFKNKNKSKCSKTFRVSWETTLCKTGSTELRIVVWNVLER